MCGRVMYYDQGDGTHCIYQRCKGQERMRHPVFVQTLETTFCVASMRLASVNILSPDKVRLHSTANASKVTNSRKGFLEELWPWENQSLWRTPECNGDGEWIREGMVRGSLQFVHDGSYMKDVTPNLCSSALIIRCMLANLQCFCT